MTPARLLFLAVVAVGALSAPVPARAQCDCGSCSQMVSGCSGNCECVSNTETRNTVNHITNEFNRHRQWLVDVFFKDPVEGDNVGLLAALQLMTNQFTTTMMQQLQGVGLFMDAKHQLETQRMFQQMTAQAHKDYHPSEGMCVIGTNLRSLAASERNTDLTQHTIAAQMMQRQIHTGDALTIEGATSDKISRLKQYRHVYCDKQDNANGLEFLCLGGNARPERVNRDIDFARTIGEPLTLRIGFTPAQTPPESDPDQTTAPSPDEEDVLALASYLYAHTVPPVIPEFLLADENGEWNRAGAYAYMNQRAVTAKRSVAQNSFAAIAALKAEGTAEAQPYLYALLKEMLPEDADPAEIETYMGTKPSYYAQMEMLTQKIYQNPGFYTELYDKPANVERKQLAMEAIGLMQKRDIYRSLLRSEAIYAVMLESALKSEQDRVTNEVRQLGQEGPLIDLE